MPYLSFTDCLPRVGAAALAVVLCLLPARRAGAEDTYHFQWLPTGIHNRVAGNRTHVLNLTTNPPAGLTNAPSGLTAPLYGALEFGLPGQTTRYPVIADAPGGHIEHLFVDGRGTGDFAGVKECTWTLQNNTPGRSVSNFTHIAEATLQLQFPAGPLPGAVRLYFTDRPPTMAAPPTLIYFADYARVGELKIDGETLPAALLDAAAAGYFRATNNLALTSILWVGLTNPPASRTGLTVPVQRPFPVGDQWYVVTNLQPDGAFTLVTTAKPADAVTPVDLRPGKKAPVFATKTTAGQTIHFPGDYAGRVVLLDFWSAMSVDSIAECTNLVAAYEQCHGRGLDILGINLDRPGRETNLVEAVETHKLVWPQIYDGKIWRGAVAEQYGIRTIPYLILVDGDTGRILANDDFHGPKLAPAIEKALTAKKPK